MRSICPNRIDALRTLNALYARVSGGNAGVLRPERSDFADLDEFSAANYEWRRAQALMSKRPAEISELNLDAVIEEVLASPYSDHVIFGFGVNGEPQLVPKSALRHHAILLGASGSGKTTLLTSLLTQHIRGSEEGPGGESPPILVVDGKPEAVLYHTARIEAERRGVPFLFFSDNPRHESVSWDVFEDFRRIGLNVNEVAQVLHASLGLNYGTGYGRSHFTWNQLASLLSRIEPPGDQLSWHRLRRTRSRDVEQELGLRRSEQSELATKLALIAREPLRSRLSVGPLSNALMSLPQAIENRAVVYVSMDFDRNPLLAGELSRMLVKTYELACKSRKEEGKFRQCFIYIDEFQAMAAPVMQSSILRARSHGVGLVLTAQVREDLKKPDVDLLASVWGSTNIKVASSFMADKFEMEIQRLSGETVRHLKGTSSAEGATINVAKIEGTTYSRASTDGVTDQQGSSKAHATGSSHEQGTTEAHGSSSGHSSGVSSNESTAHTAGSTNTFGPTGLVHTQSSATTKSKGSGSSYGTHSGVSSSTGTKESFGKTTSKTLTASESRAKSKAITDSRGDSHQDQKGFAIQSQKTETLHPERGPILQTNDLRRIGSDPNAAVLHVGTEPLGPLSREGFAVPIRTPYPLSFEEWTWRDSQPPPRRRPDQMLAEQQLEECNTPTIQQALESIVEEMGGLA